MRRLAAVLVGLVLIAAPGAGTEDHWATTYNVVPDPQGGGVTIIPIRFLTHHSSPETEINAVSEPNHLDRRGSALPQDANLASLCGIKVRVIDHSVSNGTVVLVDLSALHAPTNLADAPDTEAVVSNTVACVVLAAKDVIRGRLEVRVGPPAGEDASKWQKYARTLVGGKRGNNDARR